MNNLIGNLGEPLDFEAKYREEDEVAKNSTKDGGGYIPGALNVGYLAHNYEIEESVVIPDHDDPAIPGQSDIQEVCVILPQTWPFTMC